MIKLEHVVLASPEQMKFIIEGMRNPMNSWEMSDSFCIDNCTECPDRLKCAREMSPLGGPSFRGGNYIGPNDHSLMQRLANAGTDHRKFMRMMPVYVRITAPLYWWKEFDTYKVGTVANSCSTMHKIHTKEFELEDFSTDHLNIAGINCLKTTITALNNCRSAYVEDGEFKGNKEVWWQMIQLLPSSYNQTRNVMMNYEVLSNIYKSRKNHKLDCWRDFCKWIEELPYSELIVSKEED